MGLYLEPVYMIWVQVTLSGTLLVRLEPVYDLGTGYSQWDFTSEARASLHDLSNYYTGKQLLLR